MPLDLGNVMELNAKTRSIPLWEIKRDLGAYLAAHGSELTVEQLTRGIASPDVKAIFENGVLGKDAISDDAYAAAIGEFRPQLQLTYLAAFRDHRLTAILFPTTPLPAQPIQGSDKEVTLNGEKVPTFDTFISRRWTSPLMMNLRLAPTNPPAPTKKTSVSPLNVGIIIS